jgi:hypothetical protein
MLLLLTSFVLHLRHGLASTVIMHREHQNHSDAPLIYVYTLHRLKERVFFIFSLKTWFLSLFLCIIAAILIGKTLKKTWKTCGPRLKRLSTEKIGMYAYTSVALFVVLLYSSAILLCLVTNAVSLLCLAFTNR